MILKVQKKVTVLNCIDEYQINSRPKFDSNHKQNLFNKNPSPLLHSPQKTIYNTVNEIKKHTIQHNNKTDPLHTKACISLTLKTKNPELLRKSTYYSVDEFIDEIIEGQETIISSDVCNKFDALTFLKAEYESRNLPPIELYKFSGDPSKWPEFIENFSKHVHFKTTFSGKQRMERLLNVLEGEAKRMVQSIGQSDIFYPTVLKCLKRDYGNLTVVSYLKLNELFNQPQLQAKNKPGFQQQLKTTVIWLSSMVYHSAIRSSDNITKAVTRLPNYLRNKFYKEFKSNDIDEKVDLLKFSHWLDERLSEVHNPIPLIIHAEEKQKKKLETSSKHKDSNRIHSLLEDNKDDKTDQENFKIICWLCTGIHKIANCEKLKNEFIENRHSLVKQKKLCFNCLSTHT